MIGLIVIVIFFLPLWSISSIEVSGASVYSKEEIIEASQIKVKRHILTVRTKKGIESLKQLPFIDDAEITYQFPNHIEIKVMENKPIGYVKFLGSYLCIGEKGQVLEQVTQPSLKLPTIEGIKFDKFKVGEKLPLEDEDHLLTVVEMISILTKYEYDGKIDNIDVSNLEQIHLYVDKLDVIIGNIRDFDKKVRWLVEIHQEYPMGILDLSYIENGQAILTPLT